MKRTIIIILALVFSVSFCAAQDPGRSVREAIETVEQNFNKAVDSAKENIRQGRFDQAIMDYEAAKKIKPDNADSINAEINNVRRLKAEAAIKDKEKRFNDAVASAERSFAAKEYDKAKSYYEEAILIKPESAPLFADKIAELDVLILEEMKIKGEQEIELRYQNAIASAETNVAQRRWGDAKQDYITARGLRPENADFIDAKIAELEKPAQLYIYRKAPTFLEIFEGNLRHLLGVRYDIMLDNKKIGETKNKWKTTETVNDLEAKTVWAAINGRSAEIHIDFEPGKVYYVRCGVSAHTEGTGEYENKKQPNGTYKRVEKTITHYTPTIVLESESVGEREFKSIKSK